MKNLWVMRVEERACGWCEEGLGAWRSKEVAKEWIKIKMKLVKGLDLRFPGQFFLCLLVALVNRH
jgi:hypothetical protein